MFQFRKLNRRAGGITGKVGGARRVVPRALATGQPLTRRGRLTPAGQAFQARLRTLRRRR